MDEKQKQKLLDAYLKRVQSGNFNLEGLVPRSSNVIEDVYNARNFQEEALGRLALDQYKGKVPGYKASEADVLDFMEGLREQFLPDVKSEIRTNPFLNSQGIFYPDEDIIELNPRFMNKNEVASGLIHEGLHSRDFRKNDYGDLGNLESGPTFNRGLAKLEQGIVDSKGRIIDPKKAKEIIKKTDLSDLVEATLEGHHGLKRGGTIGKVNLQRLMKGMPLLGAGAAVLMDSDDVSASIPILNEAENVGESARLEAARLRDRDAQAQQDKIMDTEGVPKEVKLKALELFKKNRIPWDG